MKKFILIAFYCFLFTPIFAESYSFENQNYRYEVYYTDWENPGFQFSFSENNFRMDIPEMNDLLIEEGQYIHETIVSPYSINKENGFLYLNANNKKYLILYYESLLCALVDCDDYTTYFGVNEESKYVNVPSNPLRLRDLWIGVSDPEHYETKTSSFLQENDIVYNGENKFAWQLKYPWVEGKSGSGIDEWIEKKSSKKTNRIVLLNGYVDPNHPDYFSKNERIKDMEITVGINKYSFTLNDTSQLQLIELPEYLYGPFRIQIKSVYPGTKYTDTCLSYFMFLNERDVQKSMK